MVFLWPAFLLLLGLIPILAAVYILALRRRRRYAVRFSSLELVRSALSSQNRWRRHIPFALFLLALAVLSIAASRPVAITSVPTNQTTIILAIDVSRSMLSPDIRPNRLAAAQAAAISFIQKPRAGTQIGLVAFGGFAEIVQPSTTDQEALEAAVESLTTGRWTAIGSGILKSLDAIAEVDKNVAPSITDANPAPAPAAVPKGAYAPDIIVLLTDGVSNMGPQPIDAAQQAADRGVRVYTIGFGTANGANPFGGGSNFGNPPFGGSPGGGGGFGNNPQFGGRFRRGIDEATLKKVSAMTGGEYYSASSADELMKVFDSLPTYMITKHETMEISIIFTAIGAILAIGAVALSFLWHPIF